MITDLIKMLFSKALTGSHPSQLIVKSKGDDTVLVSARKDNGDVVETEVTTFNDEEMEKIGTIKKSVMAY
ncbi:hypothetical protein [Spirosoma sp.]|uniref:hypothetical protein n=1 Tax=Spirosoma sp. TaxID=1899569 RepID=UPI003B3B9FBA